ncbi:MAG TPA: DNA methyltransferase [Candidatus Obscuribacterales bacterium]
MAEPPALRSVLSHLKKHALSRPAADAALKGEQLELLSALLLQVGAACRQEKESLRQCQALYESACRLAPAPIRNVMPFPTAKQLQESRQLLVAPPHVVSSVDPCILGYLYQFFCSRRREEAKRRVQIANKSPHRDDAIAFTQLYTPTPVADYLLRQCLATKSERPLTRTISEMTILDPSCGAGNFLLRAFDLIMAAEPAEDPRSRGETAQKILQQSLHGCDIDAVGLWVCCLSIAARLQSMKLTCDKPLQLELLNQDHDEDGCALGTLENAWPPGHMLADRYHAVVGNPPYIGRKLLGRKTKERLRQLYPDAHHDLCNAFIDRGLQLLKAEGRLGYITQSSLLYLPSYSNFRRQLIEHYRIVSIAEAGSHVFPLQTGEKVNSVLIVLENGKPDGTPVNCSKLSGTVDIAESDAKNSPPDHAIDQKQFLLHRANAFNYSCPQAVLQIRSKCNPLSQHADIRQGLATSNNERFVKWWWQVPFDEIGQRWFPYVKGAGSERWFAPVKTVIDWQDNGMSIKQAVAETYPYLEGKINWVVKNERFYFRKGLTFSLVNTRQLCVRELPSGCIFDVAGSAVFTEEQDEQWLLAYLNSSLIAACAQVLNPTINFQVGDLKELSVIPLSVAEKRELMEISLRCVELKKMLSEFSDSNISFAGSGNRPVLGKPALQQPSYAQTVAAVQAAIDNLQACEIKIDDLVLQAARRHCALDKTDSAELESICRQAADRRKPVVMPFSSEEQYARLLLRLTLYAMQPGKLDAKRIHDRLSDRLDWFEATIGCSVMNYLQDQFVKDQMKALHNSVRMNVQAAGNDGVCLLSNFPSRARSHS